MASRSANHHRAIEIFQSDSGSTPFSSDGDMQISYLHDTMRMGRTKREQTSATSTIAVPYQLERWFAEVISVVDALREEVCKSNLERKESDKHEVPPPQTKQTEQVTASITILGAQIEQVIADTSVVSAQIEQVTAGAFAVGAHCRHFSYRCTESVG
ncbi:hypothetical protein LWI29_032518 [Acer saccharum]|uniref:Uncharacterized protein n=1 Tax=Acer saccharum TaxID=4024 RepID=A0AA39W155_ACESA|nr:hypothetical protein LWI29_032518 [Acer saccharum]